MTVLEEHVKRYVARRADGVSPSDADLLVARALVRPGRRRPRTRHGLNIGLALGIALLLIAGGVIVPAQLRNLRANQSVPASGALPAIPKEIVNLDDPSQVPQFVVPFRVDTGTVLAPRSRWSLPQNRALMLDAALNCSTTKIHVVDRSTQISTQQPVTLKDCYGNPLVLPGTTVLLDHWTLRGPKTIDLGASLYDWSAGGLVREYPGISMAAFAGGLVSPDGSLVYTLNPFVDEPALDITKLPAGTRIAHIPVTLDTSGLSAGGLALSVDGRTLYVNEGYQLATFDGLTGAPGPTVSFQESKKSALFELPGWLSSIDVEAKEGFEPGHGIAIDPKGRWVAALGSANRETEGVWLFGAKGAPHLIRRIHRTGGLGGIAFSLDGSVLYFVEGQSTLVAMDPLSGRTIKEFHYPYATGIYGIAGVEKP